MPWHLIRDGAEQGAATAIEDSGSEGSTINRQRGRLAHIFAVPRRIGLFKDDIAFESGRTTPRAKVALPVAVNVQIAQFAEVAIGHSRPGDVNGLEFDQRTAHGRCIGIKADEDVLKGRGGFAGPVGVGLQANAVA